MFLDFQLDPRGEFGITGTRSARVAVRGSKDGEAFVFLHTTPASPQGRPASGEGRRGFPSSQEELIGLCFPRRSLTGSGNRPVGKGAPCVWRGFPEGARHLRPGPTQGRGQAAAACLGKAARLGKAACLRKPPAWGRQPAPGTPPASGRPPAWGRPPASGRPPAAARNSGAVSSGGSQCHQALVSFFCDFLGSVWPCGLASPTDSLPSL